MFAILESFNLLVFSSWFLILINVTVDLKPHPKTLVVSESSTHIHTQGKPAQSVHLPGRSCESLHRTRSKVRIKLQTSELWGSKLSCVYIGCLHFPFLSYQTLSSKTLSECWHCLPPFLFYSNDSPDPQTQEHTPHKCWAVPHTQQQLHMAVSWEMFNFVSGFWRVFLCCVSSLS